MIGWCYIIAGVVAVWSVMRMFSAERSVRIAEMEIEHLREQTAIKRAKARRGEL